MGKKELLAQLKDIHLPKPITGWPLAPGWYLIFIMLFVLSLFLALKLRKSQVHARPKKQALQLLANYQGQYQKEKNTQQASAQVSELLKRVALAYYPREHVAALHGEAWIAFLNQSAKGLDFKGIKTMLLDLPFKPQATADLKPLFSKAKLWIQQRGVPCSN